MNHAAASYLLALMAFSCLGLAAGSDPEPAARTASADGTITPATVDRTAAAGDRAGDARGSAPGAAAASDRAFVQAAAQAGRQGIVDARDAMQRARRGEVRSAAKSMLDQRTEANAALEALAARKGWPLPPAAPDPAPARLPGEDFDSAYVAHQVGNHRQAIALFRAQSESAVGDPDLANLARATLPILEHHLDVLVGLSKPGVQQP